MDGIEVAQPCPTCGTRRRRLLGYIADANKESLAAAESRLTAAREFRYDEAASELARLRALAAADQREGGKLYTGIPREQTPMGMLEAMEAKMSEDCPSCKTHRATIATLTPLVEELKAEKKTLQERSAAEQKELASLREAVSAPEKLLEAHRTGCTDKNCTTKVWYDAHDRAIVEAALKDPALVNPAYTALQPKVREVVYK